MSESPASRFAKTWYTCYRVYIINIRMCNDYVCHSDCMLFATWRTKLLSCLEFGVVLGLLMLAGTWHATYILQYTYRTSSSDIAYDTTGSVVARCRPTKIWSSISKRCGSSSRSFQAGASAPLIEPRSDLALSLMVRIWKNGDFYWESFWGA